VGEREGVRGGSQGEAEERGGAEEKEKGEGEKRGEEEGGGSQGEAEERGGAEEREEEVPPDVEWCGRNPWNDLECCGRTFVNMGALYQHEKWAHYGGVSPPKVPKMQRRKSYTIRFKATILGAYDDRRALKCKTCSGILAPGILVEEPENYKGTCCGRTDFKRDFK
jgi:hypothetical protein